MGNSPSAIVDAIKGDSEEKLILIEGLLKQDSGVDLNYHDEEGKTALHWAAMLGHTEIISLLLDKEADPEAQDIQGCTPLTAAVFTGKAAATSLLLERGAAIDAPNKDGMTPLHWAIIEGHFECVEVLISKGADTHFLNAKEQTPLDMISKLKPKLKRAKMEQLIERCCKNPQYLQKKPTTLAQTFQNMGTGVKTDSSGNGVSAATFSAQRLRRMLALCKIWGYIKFTHPYFIHQSIDWDQALLETLPRANAAVSSEQFKESIQHLLSFLNDPNTRCIEKNQQPATQSLPSIGKEREQPYVETSFKDVAVLVATQHEAFTDFQRTVAFMNCFRELTNQGYKGIVFDLRLKKGSPAITHASYTFKFMLNETFRTILTSTVNLPTFRQRVHSGYPQQRDFGNVFNSGFTASEGEFLTPNQMEPNSPQKLPWIILLNTGTPHGIVDLSSGLQTAGLAKIILERDEKEPEVEIGITVIRVNVSEEIAVVIRKNERINADGTIGFFPDATVAVAGTQQDNALNLAVDTIRNGRVMQKKEKPIGKVYLTKQVEHDHMDEQLPAKEVRMLALFRFWNVIQYFFPYKSLMDKPWDDVLMQFIPRLEEVKTSLDYTLTVAELIAATNDSHASCTSAVLNGHVGTYVPPIEVRRIQNKTVITHFFDTSLQLKHGLNLGDEIIGIGDDDVEIKIKNLSAISPASTPQALQLKVHQKLLAGEKDSTVSIEVVTDKGITKIPMLRSMPLTTRIRAGKLPTFCVLPQGYGYIDTISLRPNEVGKALETVKDTPSLILDIRGYPKGTIYELAPRFIDHKVTVAVFQTPYLVPSSLYSELEPSVVQEEHKMYPSPHWKYKGKVIALVNEETISHAEHSCLFLEPCGVVFIGTATNGANGNVTNVQLPGGILAGFTGLGTLHGDGKQFQRLGVQPHVLVEPTVQGIRKEEDEIFNRAIKYLQESSKH